MTPSLDNKKVAILVADGFEQIELTSPRQALIDAGAQTVLVSLKPGEVQGTHHGEKQDRFKVEATVNEVSPDDFDALLLPGGLRNPDTLRMDERAVSFVKGFFDQSKPVAAICHGPWLLVEADVVKGRRVTSYKSIKTDLINAGGRWSDEPCVVDHGLVTSRTPDDLADFNAKLVEEVAEGIHA